VDLSPLAPRAAVCPLDGCGRKAAPVAEAAPVFCSGGGASACGGAQPGDCTERALAAWSDAQDERSMACVAQMLTDACTADDTRACAFAGRLWVDGRGVARDPERGLDMLVRACDAGAESACGFASRWLAEVNNTHDMQDAPDLRRRLDIQSSCLAGQSNECLKAGLSFATGRDGFPQDNALAAAAYARGCDLGESTSCNDLGTALVYGDGVARNVERASALFERSCHLGCPLGCSGLGYMAEHGLGVPRDEARARALYRDACAAFDPYGCLHVEMLAALDAGAPRDGARALAHFSRACDRSRDGRACAFVGLLYQDGPDTLSRDGAKSDEAMSRSCDLGYRRACDWVKQFHASEE
jgi:uncharacterized protein